MGRFIFERMTNSIPIDSMPLNKNFVSVESRLKSFAKCEKLIEDPKELSEAGLVYIKGLDKGMDFLFCFNCGHISQLTKDGKVLSNTIYHSKLCNIIPHPNVKNDVTSLAISNGDAKRKNEEEHLKNSSRKENSDIKTKAANDVKSKNMEKEGPVKNEVVEDEETYDNDEEIFDDHEKGLFWYCKSCGQDRDIKLMNMPCKHRTHCVSCIGNVKECCFCNNEIIWFYPAYFL